MEKNLNNNMFELSKALLPAIMTIVSFVCFLLVYRAITIRAVEPYYFEGLLFLIPTISFGFIAFLMGKKKIKLGNILTALSIPVFAISAFIGLITLSIQAATTSINDVSKYERVLKLTGYPNNIITSSFPSKIPSDASDIYFHYNPAFMQGGENFALRFKGTSKTIDEYIDTFSLSSNWSGTCDEARTHNNSVYQNTGGYLVGFDSYGEFPESYTIYLICGQYIDSNRGKICVISISKERNEIIFYAKNW